LNDNIIIRSYRPGDEEEIVELLELAFNGWPNFDLSCTPLEHWIWKYKDNPRRKIIISVSVSSERIVGFQHTIPFGIKIGENTVPCFQGIDLVIHPDYRRKGIRRLLRKKKDALAEKEGIKFKISIENKPIAIKSQKRRQYTILSDVISLVVRIRDIDLFLKTNRQEGSLLKKYGFHIISLGNRLKNLFSRDSIESDKVNEFEVVEIKEFDDRINLFWNQIKDHHSLIIEKKKEYLNWRYCDPRGGEFLVKIAESERRILGYIVLRIKCSQEANLQNSVGYIVDLLTLPDRFDVAEALLDEGTQYFDENFVNLIQSFIVKNHPTETLFRKRFFLNSRINFSIAYKSFDISSRIDSLKNPGERIHIQYGDTDWI